MTKAEQRYLCSVKPHEIYPIWLDLRATLAFYWFMKFPQVRKSRITRLFAAKRIWRSEHIYRHLSSSHYKAQFPCPFPDLFSPRQISAAGVSCSLREKPWNFNRKHVWKMRKQEGSNGQVSRLVQRNAMPFVIFKNKFSNQKLSHFEFSVIYQKVGFWDLKATFLGFFLSFSPISSCL